MIPPGGRTNGMINQSSSELGDFLRSRREKLSPSALGLAKRRRRRTPGLRREEVAELAGIGVDWYIRLEQGRAARPSVTTVDSLARALRLSKEERAHLRALAERRDRRPFARETAPEPMRRLIESLNQPAYITGRRWDVLAWNAAAAEIFGDFGRFAEKDRNILNTMLTKPAARRLFGAGWANEAMRMVAQFRASYDVWAGDPAFEELVARLRRESPEFASWWEAHDIRMAGGGQKLLDTPTMGLVRFDYATFQANDDPALRLAIYRRA
jgi:transcriptional regulator with XRE-family HTH domain